MIATKTILNQPATSVPSPPRMQLGMKDMKSLMELEAPRRSRFFAKFLFVILILAIVGMVFLPWQQTVQGRGQVLAFKPTDRQQAVSAPIDGLVDKWHVWEGSRVKIGDPIVDLVHPDPQFETRLQTQKKALESRIEEFNGQIKQREELIAQQQKSRIEQLNIADRSIEAANQTEKNRNESVKIANEALRLAMKEQELFTEGVKSGVIAGIRVLQIETQVNIAKNNVARADADLLVAKQTVLTTQDAKKRIDADTNGTIAQSQQEINRLTGDRFTVERELQEIRIRLASWDARFVKSPCEGTVLRIEENAGQGGAQVKAGTNLAIIVPDGEDFVIELFMDGVDAPLIQRDENGRYPHVRIQFEGWPAVQFTGWPSAAYGTFGGRVRQIDATNNAKGQFRVLIEPDPMWPDDVWPSKEFLRQGNHAIGWVFLQRVTLGWEVWRRVNGFPPVVAPEEPGKKKK